MLLADLARIEAGQEVVVRYINEPTGSTEATASVELATDCNSSLSETSPLTVAKSAPAAAVDGSRKRRRG